MKLSIIVPIYNVAPYLRKCVDSLLAQDFSDYEIILVDDGSTDGSGEIADELQFLQNSPLQGRAYLPSIKVIHQENKGLSEARNTGVKAAQGDYVCFVDSDDYWEHNVLGALMGQIERDKLDVLRFRYQNVRENGEAFSPYKDMTNYNDYSSIPTDGLTFLNERMGIQCYAWQFVVSRAIAQQELFTPSIYFEDTDWTPRMLLKTKRSASIDKLVYNYLWREGSITLCQKDVAKQRKQLNDKLNLLVTLNALGNAVTNRRWFDGMISSTTINIIGTIASLFYEERKNYIQKIKKMNILPLSSYLISPRAKKKVRLINLSIELAVWQMKWGSVIKHWVMRL